MLTTPTPEQLLAFASFTAQGRWRGIEAYLAAEIEAAVTAIIENRDSALVNECRGRVKALRELQSTARDASEMLKKMGVANPL